MIITPEPVPFRKITIELETAEELGALLAVLDTDRNHPVRRRLYERLVKHRAEFQGQPYVTPYRESYPPAGSPE